MINFAITLSKWLWNHEPQASGSAVNLFFTITRPQNGQMPGINEGKRRRKVAVMLIFSIKRPQNGQMPGIHEDKRHRKLAVNKVNLIQNDANIVNSFSRFLIGN